MAWTEEEEKKIRDVTHKVGILMLTELNGPVEVAVCMSLLNNAMSQTVDAMIVNKILDIITNTTEENTKAKTNVFEDCINKLVH